MSDSIIDADVDEIRKYEIMSLDELALALITILSDDNERELQRFITGATKKYEEMPKDGSNDRAKLEYFITNAKSAIKPVPSRDEDIGRVADIEFDIETSTMTYTFDLHSFQNRVDELFKWHDENDKAVQNKYMAPYFPLVQSSGMGKTKLLHELSKKYDAQVQKKQPPSQEGTLGAKSSIPSSAETQTVCKLVLCTIVDSPHPRAVNSIFTNMLQVPRRSAVGFKQICRELDLLLTDNDGDSDRRITADDDDANKTKQKRYVLLFDEAQHLLQRESDGWAFRCVRWWLRKVRTESVVAVFTGTTSKLANFYREVPNSTTLSTSRDANILLYYGQGTELYEPFFEICTIGLLAATPTVADDTDVIHGTEYRKSIPFGRPLFARLQQRGALTKNVEYHILCRMTLSITDWSLSDKACLSILATRAQMGQVAFDLASELVSSGYANLTFCSNDDSKVADICFFPDPVCARLAMSLMTEDYTWKNTHTGKKPAFWMEKATKIFSHGLCRPSKGDVGEVAAAFYLLFCGDQLRHNIENNNDLETFSVPLAQWVSLLQGLALDPKGDVNDSMSTANFAEPSISFIQLCRNYLRLSLTDLMPLLPGWYKAGRALYQYPSCPVYDIIAPIRYKSSTGKLKYCPLLVSVKNRLYFGKGEQNIACAEMENFMKNAGIKVGVCLLLLFLGEQDNNVDTDQLINPSMMGTDEVTHLKPSRIVTRVVVVPKDDPFGVSKFLDAVSTGGGHLAEVYVSHAEVLLTTTSETKNMLRKTTDKNATEFAESMHAAFKVAATTPAPVVAQSGRKRTMSKGDVHDDE